jgi:hypothetical protein
MPTYILLAIRSISALMKLQAADEFAGLRDDVQALIAKLTPGLPAKPDGSAWTDDDIHAAAEKARLPWQDVISRGTDAIREQ